jgi:hypothetical protein
MLCSNNDRKLGWVSLTWAVRTHHGTNRLIPRWGPGLGANGLPVGWLVFPCSAKPQSPTAHHAVALLPISLTGGSDAHVHGGSGQFNRLRPPNTY